MTNLRSLSDLLRVARNLAAACAFATVMAAAVSAQTPTNTLEPTGNAGVGTTTPATAFEVRGGGVTSRVTTTGTSGANGKFQLFSADITNNPFGEMQLFAPTGAGSEYLRFNFRNSSGNIPGRSFTTIGATPTSRRSNRGPITMRLIILRGFSRGGATWWRCGVTTARTTQQLMMIIKLSGCN